MNYIIDNKNLLDAFFYETRRIPFKESLFVYFVKCSKNNENWYIKEYARIDKWVKASDNISLKIPMHIILASCKYAQKHNLALMFAHTHPPADMFPPECKVYKEAAFSDTDLKFNGKINELLLNKFNYRLPIYYLVADKYSYCAILFWQKKYNIYTIQINSAKYNIKKSTWSLEYYEHKE